MPKTKFQSLPGIDEFLYAEKGDAHLYAHRLGLVAPGHDAAVVVAQHYDRTALQRRLEGPFARYEEVVAVGEGEQSLFPVFLVVQEVTQKQRLVGGYGAYAQAREEFQVLPLVDRPDIRGHPERMCSGYHVGAGQ